MTTGLLILAHDLELLRERGRELAEQKKKFLPESRTSMINDDETNKIILSAFQYVVALQELIKINLNFLVNCYVYENFKERLQIFPREISNRDWGELIPPDSTLDDGINELKSKISAIKTALNDVQQMQMKF